MLGGRSEGLFAPSGKSSAKAQHSLRERVGSFGCCCFPEQSAPQRGGRNHPKEKPSSPGHPLCLREKRGHVFGKSLTEMDSPVTTVPTSMTLESEARRQGDQKSRWHCCRANASKQERLPSEEHRATGKTMFPHSSAEKQKPGCSGISRGQPGHGLVLHSEKGVWAEVRPLLSFQAQGDISSLATGPSGSLCVFPRRVSLYSQKKLPRVRGSRLPSSFR